MKRFFQSFQWKPRDLRDLCDKHEDNAAKARIVGWACIGFAVASGYDWYFNNLTYRSQQFQGKVLAGDLTLPNLIDKHSDIYWDALNTYDFLDEKDFKDVKYIDA